MNTIQYRKLWFKNNFLFFSFILFYLLFSFTLGPDLYDSPSNTSSLTSQNPTPTPYTYARKESLYSVVTPKSRKGSMDSHLYDEIRYPTAMHHAHHTVHHTTNHNAYIPHHQPQQQHQPLSHHSAINQHQHQLQQPIQNHHHHQQQQHHHTLHHNPQGHTTTHHVSHLIIPPQNTKYLQVPQMTHTSHKVAHI